jgi:hypothetical protein
VAFILRNLFLEEVPCRQRSNQGPSCEVVHPVHDGNLLRWQIVKRLFVPGWLERQPDVPAERNSRRLQLAFAVVAPIIPCHGEIREPQQEREHPEISVRRKPVPERKNERKNDTLDVKLERFAWEESTSHYISIREFFPRSHAGHPARNIGGNECV